MHHTLPPLHTLRAFEAVARLLSFSQAGAELGVTHGAVSHQIKQLETCLGAPLFLRNSRAVSLTAVGGRYVAVVRSVLDQLSTATREAAGQHAAPRLSLSVLPSFASRWLLARLGEFIALHPDIDVKLSATQRRVAPAEEGIDLAVRNGRSGWDGVRTELICHEDVMPVASPALARQLRLTSARHLGRSVLLQDPNEPWKDWFADVGLPNPQAGRRLGPVFDDAGLLLQAAEAGQGVALARRYLVADALAARRLVRVGARAARSRNAYYFVYPPNQPPSASAVAFTDWLRARMRGDARQAA